LGIAIFVSMCCQWISCNQLVEDFTQISAASRNTRKNKMHLSCVVLKCLQSIISDPKVSYTHRQRLKLPQQYLPLDVRTTGRKSSSAKTAFSTVYRNYVIDSNRSPTPVNIPWNTKWWTTGCNYLGREREREKTPPPSYQQVSKTQSSHRLLAISGPPTIITKPIQKIHY
jgi:hypothetical protein